MVVLNTSPAWAIGKRDIPSDLAENGVSLSLSQGYGVVISLASLGQRVSTAWLSDPSQITLSSNQGACTGDACAGASVLYLKPIDRLNFPGLPSALDGASLLSIITDQGKVLQFKLSVTRSVPSYTSVALVPEQQQRITPPARQPNFPIQQAVIPVPEPQIVFNLPPSEKEEIEILNRLTERKQKSSQSEPQEFKLEEKIEVASEPPSAPPPESKPGSNSAPSSDPEVAPKNEIETDESAPETKPIGFAVVVAIQDSQPTPQPSVERSNQELAGALLRGLHSQRGRQEVGRRSIYSRTAQDVIWLLKKYPEMSLAQAIARARMDENVAKNLIKYGTK